jgi:large subunit ribosomal protein L13
MKSMKVMSSLTIPIHNPLCRLPQWWHINAKGHRVGRLATQIARLLQGKHKPTYIPNMDCGDFVVVTNARYVDFSGKKWDQKVYRWHTQWPGGLKKRTVKEMLQRKPTEILMRAVKGMLPRTRLAKQSLRKLLIFPDSEHPFDPEKLTEFLPIETWSNTPLLPPYGATGQQIATFSTTPEGRLKLEIEQIRFSKRERAILRRMRSYGLKYGSLVNSDPSNNPWPHWEPLPRMPYIRKRYSIKEKPFSHLLGEVDPKNPKAKLPIPPQIYAGAPQEYKIIDSRRPPVIIGSIEKANSEIPSSLLKAHIFPSSSSQVEETKIAKPTSQ